MSALKASKLLGDTLLQNDGTLVSIETIVSSHKTLGLYFSSFSCPSCISFTPELLKFYNNLKEHQTEKSFEIIHVNSDLEEKDFAENFKRLPWLALPFNKNELKVALTKSFKVKSIPYLVLIDAKSCELITPHGMASVLDDPLGSCFPWKLRDSVEVLNELSLINSKNEIIEFKNLSSCIKGIYFSAHWCPPCKAFTPALVNLYKNLEKKGQKFEIIFVSSDLGHQSFDQYFSTMPWLAVPYEDDQRRKELAYLYGIGGIPTLVILDEDNSVITKEGRIEVNDDPDGEDFPWRPKLVDELSEKHVAKLNEEPCLILFTACNEKDLDAAHYLLLPVAEEYKARLQRAKAEDTSIPHLNFFYAGDAEICDSVRDAVQVDDHIPFVVILDTSNNCKYILENQKEVTGELIGKFVRDFLSSKLTAYPVGL